MSKEKTPRQKRLNEEHQVQRGLKAMEQEQGKLAIRETEQAADNIRRLIERLEPIAIELPEDNEGLWNYAVHHINQVSVNLAKAGFSLIKLKEQAGHGNFIKELEARDIPDRTARNAMKVANLLLSLPPSKLQEFAKLGGSKLIELARLPDDVIEEMADSESLDGKTLDSLDTMSVRQLKEEVRKIKERHARELEVKDKDIKRKDSEIVRLTGDIADMKRSELPPDEAEKETLRQIERLHVEAMALFGSIRAHFKPEEASLSVMIRLTQFAEYMECHGRAFHYELMSMNPGLWDAAPTSHEVDEAHRQLEEVMEKIDNGLSTQGLN